MITVKKQSIMLITFFLCIFVSGCITGSDTDGDGEVDAVSIDVPQEELVNSVYKTDSDGDGYADEVDAFPNDKRYHLDSDEDGYADEVDAFPNDKRYHSDNDGDGYADEMDDFPEDARYHSDYDKDGYADEIDEFKTDSKYHATCSKCDGAGVIYTDYTRDVGFTKNMEWQNEGIFNPDYFGYVDVVNVDPHDGTFEVTAWFEDNGVNMWEETQMFYIGSGSSHEFVFHYDADENMDYFYSSVTPPTYIETVKTSCTRCNGAGKV